MLYFATSILTMDPPPPDLVLDVDQNNHNNEDDSDSAPLSDDANLDELLGEMEVAGVCQVNLDPLPPLLSEEERQRDVELYRLFSKCDNPEEVQLMFEEGRYDSDFNFKTAVAGFDENHGPICLCGEMFESQGCMDVEENEENEPYQKACEELVKEGRCPHIVDEGQNTTWQSSIITPVHVLAGRGFVNALRYLCDKIDLDVQTSLMQRTALHMAVLYGQDATCNLLLDSGANPDLQCKKGRTPLHIAAESETPEIFAALLRHKCDVNKTDYTNTTPLHMATWAHNVRYIEMLMRAGADPNMKGPRGITPLIQAARSGSVALMRALLDSGRCDLTQRDPHLDTPLHIIMHHGSVEGVELLLRLGADPNSKTNDSHTPLMLAAISNVPAVVRLLLKYGADVNGTNDVGYSALHLAAWDGHLEIVMELLNHGAHSHVLTNDKNTALALAAHGNFLRVVEVLLRHPVDVNNADKDADTALHYAAYNGNRSIVMALLQHGAHPDSENNLRTTPLWNAVYIGCIEVVKILIAKNVPMEIPSCGIDQHNNNDQVLLLHERPISPLEVAVRHGAGLGIARLLIESGYDLTNEHWIYNFQQVIPENLRIEPAARDWLLTRISNPTTLKEVCRNQTRRILGLGIREKAKQLELPRTLVDYLLLTEELFGAVHLPFLSQENFVMQL